MSMLDDLDLSDGLESNKDKKTKDSIKEVLNHVDTVDLSSPELIKRSEKMERKTRRPETKRRGKYLTPDEKKAKYEKDKRFWLKELGKEVLPAVRNSTFKEEYCDQMIEYFASAKRYRVITDKTYDKDGTLIKEIERKLPKAPPLFTSFATLLGVSSMTLNRWRKSHSSFDEAYVIAKDIQASHIVNNSMEEITKGNFPTFMMKNCHSWSDKTEVKVQKVKTLEDTINESFNEPIEVENEYKTKEIEHEEDI